MAIDNSGFGNQRRYLTGSDLMTMDISDPATELWASYSADKNIEIRNKIFQHYSLWIKKVSSYQYSKYRADLIEWSDCVQNASIALLESIDKYDMSRGIPFEAFAYSRVKGAILNGLAASSKHYVKTTTTTDFFDIADNINLSDNFDDSFDQFLDAVIDIAFSKLLDISSYRFSQIGIDPLDSYIINSEEKKVLSAVKKLPSELQFIIVSHYNHFLTFIQIAEKLNISKSRVSQLHKDALKKLRNIYENI